MEMMKKQILTAREEKQRTEQIRQMRKTIGAAVIAAAALFTLLPNTSEGVAYAMGTVPVVGRLARAVTFRDYPDRWGRTNTSVGVFETAGGGNLHAE